jgi:hypothetical protein
LLSPSLTLTQWHPHLLALTHIDIKDTVITSAEFDNIKRELAELQGEVDIAQVHQKAMNLLSSNDTDTATMIQELQQQLAARFDEQPEQPDDPINNNPTDNVDQVSKKGMGEAITKEKWNELVHTPLYNGSSMSIMEAILLVHQYTLHSNTNRTHTTELIPLIHYLLPEGNKFPPTYYKFMKV